MAKLLWGKVYLYDQFAGILREEPGGRFAFQYDAEHVSANCPTISITLPLQTEAHLNEAGLHPYFDNLVAEGWLENAQMRLLGSRSISRFELLLAFGYDCAGAVSIIDSDETKQTDKLLNIDDSREMAAYSSHASLSGVQAKLAVIKSGRTYEVAKHQELSTHIAKFSSSSHPDIIFNEYLCTIALKALLPDEKIVQLNIGQVTDIDIDALLVERFDRSNGKRIHFEEFNQLLGHYADQKYDGSYADMADFIQHSSNCLPVQAAKLYSRILAGLLLGNTDMHLKNFAMLHTENGLELTPSYDQVAASLYQYQTVALSLADIKDLRIGQLKAKKLVMLGESFGLSHSAIGYLCEQLETHLPRATKAIESAPHGNEKLKSSIIKLMEKRWNESFALIGRHLLKNR